MRRLITTLVFLSPLFWSFKPLLGTTYTAQSSGNWNAITWLPATSTPKAGDEIIIPSGITVALTESLDLSTSGDNTPTSILVSGSLVFLVEGNNCSGGVCDIDLILDTGSEVQVYAEDGIQEIGPGNGKKDIIIGGEKQLSSFPFGPGVVDDSGAMSGGIGLGPLPVELSAFLGTALKKSNHITWTTDTEENTALFILERSKNGRNRFQEIARVEAIGFSDISQTYFFEDKAPISIGYYRLRILDFDGSVESSPIIVVERAQTELKIVEIFPNPTFEEAQILVHTSKEGPAILSLFNHSGQLLMQERVELQEGINQFSCSNPRKKDTVYYFTLYDGENTIQNKIIFNNPH